MNRRLTGCIAVLFLLAVTAMPVFAVSYTMIDLGGIGDGWNYVATSINSHGDVAGYYSSSVGHHGFVYTTTTGMVDIGTLGGDYSEAYGINDAGQIVGVATDAEDMYQHAFLYTPGIGMQKLNIFGNEFANARAINSLGQVTGTFADNDGSSHAYLYDPKTGASDLGNVPGHFLDVTGMNDQGAVVGYSGVPPTGDVRAAVQCTQAGGFTSLGLPGDYSYAQGINSHGDIVGSIMFDASHQSAFMYHPGSDPLILPGLGGNRACAYAVNDLGQIAGTANAADNMPRAFAYAPGIGTVELPTPARDYSEALSINSLGQIAGLIATEDGYKAVVWTPVPEPGSFLILGSGLVAVLGMMRRKK